MLHEFITTNEHEIIARTRAKLISRSTLVPTEDELKNGVSLFLRQLGDRLRLSASDNTAIEESATEQGGALQKMGFTVGQVVHGYGDVGQAVTELAVEAGAPITTGELHTLARCLNDAIAQAVSEHARLREQSIASEGVERSRVLAHDLRNRLSAAMLSFNILKMEDVAIGGSTGAVLGRSLERMCDLVRRSAAQTPIDPGATKPLPPAIVDVVEEEVEVDASSEANARSSRRVVA
jgi:hypothetical protein